MNRRKTNTRTPKPRDVRSVRSRRMGRSTTPRRWKRRAGLAVVMGTIACIAQLVAGPIHFRSSPVGAVAPTASTVRSAVPRLTRLPATGLGTRTRRSPTGSWPASSADFPTRSCCAHVGATWPTPPTIATATCRSGGRRTCSRGHREERAAEAPGLGHGRRNLGAGGAPRRRAVRDVRHAPYRQGASRRNRTTTTRWDRSASTTTSTGRASCVDTIEPSPFVDPDGTAWLLYKVEAGSNRIVSQRLTRTALSLTGPASVVLQPTLSWENGNVEGPSLAGRDGLLFLLFSANDYRGAGYRIGYATSATPAGPCQVSNEPFLTSSAGLDGPGGTEMGARWGDRD